MERGSSVLQIERNKIGHFVAKNFALEKYTKQQYVTMLEAQKKKFDEQYSSMDVLYQGSLGGLFAELYAFDPTLVSGGIKLCPQIDHWTGGADLRRFPCYHTNFENDEEIVELETQMAKKYREINGIKCQKAYDKQNFTSPMACDHCTESMAIGFFLVCTDHFKYDRELHSSTPITPSESILSKRRKKYWPDADKYVALMRKRMETFSKSNQNCHEKHPGKKIRVEGTDECCFCPDYSKAVGVIKLCNFCVYVVIGDQEFKQKWEKMSKEKKS